MAITPVVVTINLANVGIEPQDGVITAVSSVPLINDLDGNRLFTRTASARITDGVGSISLIPTDAATDPTDFSYTLTLKARGSTPLRLEGVKLPSSDLTVELGSLVDLDPDTTPATYTGSLANHLTDTTAAHAASAISYAGSANLAAVNVEAALDELDEQTTGLRAPLSRRESFPTFTRSGTVAAATATGESTVGYPCVIRVTGLIGSPLADFYAFTSADHGSGAGGIHLWHFNTLGGAWTYYGKVVTHPEGGAEQIETPWVVWDQVTSTFRCYAQALGTITGKDAGQVTCVWTSTDCITWTYVGISHDIESTSDLAQTQGGTHTGYQQVWSVGGMWVSRGLIRGSLGVRWATYYSLDGLTFYHDRSEDAGYQEVAPAGRLVTLFNAIRWGGKRYGVGVSRTLVAGGTAGTADLVVGEVRADCSGFAAMPAVAYTPGAVAAGDNGDIAGHCVLVDRGDAHLFYHGSKTHIIHATGA